MQMWVLGSGSRGNAVVLEASGSRILIDAGFAPPILISRMRDAEIAPESIEAVVVTHEHVDHVRGVRALAETYGWTSYATPGTITASRDLRDTGTIPYRPGDSFAAGEFDVSLVRAPHDAAEPVVLVATARRTGARAGIAYDLGCATQAITESMRDLDVLLLEANHDELMLHNGPYPPSVRARIAGRNGHLSNRAAGQLARDVAHKGLNHLVLGHLSETCNDPRTAVRDVSTAVHRTRFAGRVSAALQDSIAGPFAPGTRRVVAVQLGLDL